MRLRFVLAVVAAGSLSMAACSDSGSATADGGPPMTVTTLTESDTSTTPGQDPTSGRRVSTYPGETWMLGSAEDAGFDAALLQQAADAIGPVGSTCMAVVHDGKLIHEAIGSTPTETPTKRSGPSRSR